jgi:hypothetical protein
VSIGAIAYDIAHGKPPSKAVVSGTAGSAAAGFFGDLAGELLTARGTGLVATAVLSGGTAIVIGTAVGLVVDVVWDHAVPAGVRGKIDEGVQKVFDAGKHAVAAAWSATENIASKVWNFLF